MRFHFLLLVLACLSALVSALAAPAPVPREFRGMWIATVGNIDWPSKPGLPAAQQQAELRALLDGAQRLNLNAVVFQVRTAADALYESALEPWSEYLSGRMGQPPSPRWDPLRFACEEAHARGLELHAWINPYRARYHGSRSPAAASHVSRKHADWTVSYGRYLWLDPGHAEAQAHTLRVVTDLVRRYDLDGLHIDDYFYPYPEKVAGNGSLLAFPDQASFGRYQRGGGRLARDDWRRDNVNRFVERLAAAVHGEKAWVKFGISPFGIWRPGSPPGIQGLDQFATLYADARLWLNRGWADYFAPQLYWPTSRREQSFPELLRWWTAQNTQDRLMIPGLSSASIGKDRASTDIANQVRHARELKADGVLFWNASSLRLNKGGVVTGLTEELFSSPALTPPTPWLGTNAPSRPELTVEFQAGGARADFSWNRGAKAEPARVLVFQSRIARSWRTEVLPAGSGRRSFDLQRGGAVPDEVWLYGVGRTGMAGAPATWLKPTAASR
jgi:uncharacterized lipoprotein YddW (UPF0748 family)